MFEYFKLFLSLDLFDLVLFFFVYCRNDVIKKRNRIRIGTVGFCNGVDSDTGTVIAVGRV